jgi:hypothetical protein
MRIKLEDSLGEFVIHNLITSKMVKLLKNKLNIFHDISASAGVQKSTSSVLRTMH